MSNKKFYDISFYIKPYALKYVSVITQNAKTLLTKKKKYCGLYLATKHENIIFQNKCH